MIAVADAPPSTGTAAVNAGSGSLGEDTSGIPNKKAPETLNRSPAAEPRSVTTIAHADSVKLVLDSIKDIALADVARVRTACITRLLAEKLRSRVLRSSPLRAAATELEEATPKLQRRTA